MKHTIALFNSQILEEWQHIDPANWQTVILDLVELFLSLGPEQYQQLRLSWQKGDWQKAAHISHSLKSSCGNVGLDRARFLLDELESTLQTQDKTAAHHLIRELDEIFDLSVGKMKAYQTELLQAERRAS